MLFKKFNKINLLLLIFLFTRIVTTQESVKQEINKKSIIMSCTGLPSELTNLIVKYCCMQLNLKDDQKTNSKAVISLFNHKQYYCAIYLDGIFYSFSTQPLSTTRVNRIAQNDGKDNKFKLEKCQLSPNAAFAVETSFSEAQRRSFVFLKGGRIDGCYESDRDSTSLAFSPDSKYLAIGTNVKAHPNRSYFELCSLSSLRDKRDCVLKYFLPELPAHNGILAIVFSNPNCFIISSNNGLFQCEIKSHEAGGGFKKINSTLLDKSTDHNLTASANGKYLAYNKIEDNRSNINIFSLENMQVVAKLTTGVINAMALSPDGQYLTIGSTDIVENTEISNLKIWDLEYQEYIQNIKIDAPVSSLLFTSIGNLFIGLTNGRTILYTIPEDIITDKKSEQKL